MQNFIKLIFYWLITFTPSLIAMREARQLVTQAIATTATEAAKDWSLKAVKAFLFSKESPPPSPRNNRSEAGRTLVQLKALLHKVQENSSPSDTQSTQVTNQQESAIIAQFSQMAQPDLAEFIGKSKDTPVLPIFCQKSDIVDLYLCSNATARAP